GAEMRSSDKTAQVQILATIDRELNKLAASIESDAIILVDAQRRTIASAGRLMDRWPHGRPVIFGSSGSTESFDGIAHVGNDTFRIVAVPLVLGNDTTIGTLYLATILDQRYAE